MSASRHRPRRPFVEELERRLVPTTFTVTTTADSGAGSLRDAITRANADLAPGTDLIQFAIANSGVQRIQLAAASGPLPTITRSLTIDGSTEGGFAGKPVILLDGSALSSGDGLDVNAAHCTIDALAIGGFTTGSGIVIGTPGTTGVMNNLVQRCYIGTDASGTTRLANGNGILIGTGASNNTIGAPSDPGAPSLGDVISGNGPRANGAGVVIAGNSNVVQNDLIGADATGAAALGNTGAGILILNGANNTIGGNATQGPLVMNAISGNGGSGVVLSGAGATGNVLAWNFIGVQMDGKTPLGNHGSGVVVMAGANKDQIGTNSTTVGFYGPNFISANQQDGIDIQDPGSNNNVVVDNDIGLGFIGSGNLGNGIVISTAGNTIGGPLPNIGQREGNFINSNRGDGIVLNGPGATNNLLISNYIGADVTLPPGNDLHNGGNGITVNQASNNTLGGTASSAGNTIGFNLGSGIALNNATGVSILGNSIYSNAKQGITATNVTLPAAPTLLTAITSDNTYITARFAAAPGQYHLEFFGSPAADPSGSGQGEFFLGSQDVTVTQATPSFPVQATVNHYFSSGNPVGVLSATLTDSTNTTSLFSQDIAIRYPGFLSMDQFSVKGPSGGGVVNVPVTRVSGSDGTITVDYTTAVVPPNSFDTFTRAVPGVDFVPSSGTITFHPGETSKNIPITTLNNPASTTVREFQVELSNPSGHAQFQGRTSTYVFSAVGVVPPPTGTPTQIYVQNTYLSVLGRAADKDGLTFWDTLLQQGMTRSQVVRSIESSMEYRIDQVQGVYITYLRRAADAGSLNFWVPFLMGGGSLEQVQAQVLGSPEYFQKRGGGTNNGFLAAVYGDVVFRDIESSARDALGSLLQAGADRASIALGVLGSFEADANLIGILYRQFLQRNADATGFNAWVHGLQTNLGIEDVIAGLVGSDEFVAKQPMSV